MRCWPVSVVLLKTTGSQGLRGLVLQGLPAAHTCGHVGQLRQCRGRGQALVAGVNYLLLCACLPLRLLPLFCICLCICIGCAAPHCLLVSSLLGAEAAPCPSCRLPIGSCARRLCSRCKNLESAACVAALVGRGGPLLRACSGSQAGSAHCRRAGRRGDSNARAALTTLDARCRRRRQAGVAASLTLASLSTRRAPE